MKWPWSSTPAVPNGSAKKEEDALDAYTATLIDQQDTASTTHDVLDRLVQRLRENHV